MKFGESAGKKLLRLVVQERNALKAGAYDRLEKILPQKESALEDVRVECKRMPPREVNEIFNVCRDIDNLYGAIRLGLSAAHQRIQSLQVQDDKMLTYDLNGKLGQGSRTSIIRKI
ncbi:hypothetical protein [Litoreibacter janthinus]|uniref:FlgN protein n=1 Tax=Litoreibacter janthinus TaxID=670154 RepID=A0A1I6FUI7_9RHOB|nr:hypothetical protein [Litoreibacter janthinus]SFR33584.1 hypothetical protein SAMN04488002_0348 [Litoreibacter janthinus]